MFADVIVDLQYGDCGKGKVTHALCQEEDYTHVIRYNGGCNAGHTIFHNGKKFVTHHIPAGVFFGIKSIIGSGCVLNVDQFFKEIGELESGGIKTNGLIFVAENTHIITKDHLEEDGKDTKIGTTKRGNGPAYRDKYDRRGLRAKDIPELEPYIVDLYDELYVNTPNSKVLFEGAQGFGLDIDWGDYPYVTSSNCISAAACMNGIPPQNIRHVWGVAKGYETYVGAKSFQPEGAVYSLIQEVGEEYGATTGRKRQVNWMDLNFLRKAIHINGVTHLVVNKMDVLEKVKSWALYKDGNKIDFNSSNEFKDLLSKSLGADSLHQIHFSSHKDKI
jgi:adenylosuccinate synthase